MRFIELLEAIDPALTAKKLGSKLEIKFKSDHSIPDDTDPEQFISYVADKIDPTPTHKYTL